MKIKNHQFKISNKGQSLIELLLFIGLLSVFLPGLLTAFVASRQGKPVLIQRQQAIDLLKQTQEEVRSIREQGWDKNIAIITPGVIYHPSISGSKWTLSLGAENLTDSFSRQLVFQEVYRDKINGNIVITPTPGTSTIDPSTIMAKTTINWTKPLISSLQSVMYLTRFKDNLTHTDNLNVTLPSGGYSDWCQPKLDINPISLAGGNPIAQQISATYQNVYLTTGGNASGYTIDHISISDPPAPSPPVAVESGSYNNFKAYGIFANTQYAFIVSDHPGLTVDIVNISSQPYGQVATYGNSKGIKGSGQNSVYVVGNVGYVTAGNYFFTFDLTPNAQGKITGSRSELGFSPQLDGLGGRIMVVKNINTNKLTAFVAVMGSTKTGLQIIDVDNPSFLKLLSKVSFSTNQTYSNLYVNSTGTRVYYISNNQLLYIIDTSNPSSPFIYNPSHLYSTNTMTPLDITYIEADKRVIIVGSADSSHEQYQVIKTDDETNPIHCGGLTAPGGASKITAIASITEPDSDVYSYIITNKTSSGTFQIIKGGPGNSGSTYSATFESAPFYSGYLTAFNRFIANITQSPPTTSIKMQVAVANQVNGNCNEANYTYIGPGGGNDFFTSTDNNTIQGTIPFGNYAPNYTNPGQCFRYKYTLSTMVSGQTPIFNKITINYSP